MPTTELEQRIMQAAEQLFLEKGFAQTSTTDIAREAGCTQALVHYYYRTKDKLFTTIFNQKLEQLLNAAQQCEYDGDFTAYMKHLLDIYFAMISANRQLPAFIINEHTTASHVLQTGQHRQNRNQERDNPQHNDPGLAAGYGFAGGDELYDTAYLYRFAAMHHRTDRNLSAYAQRGNNRTALERTLRRKDKVMHHYKVQSIVRAIHMRYDKDGR